MSFLRKIARTFAPRKKRPRPFRRQPSREAAPTVERLEPREVPATMGIGMNLERVADYMAGWMFTDAFKSARPWVPSIHNLTTGEWTPDVNHLLSVDLDAKGWPTHLDQTTNAQGQVIQQVLDTYMLDHLGGHYPGGTYTAWWDGTGNVTWQGDVRVIKTGMTPEGHHFALLADTPGDYGIGMRIMATSPADPIRNVHVWLPDYNGQSFVGQVWQPGAGFSPFHPLFLERLAPFHTLRFMQDQAIIPSQVQHWSDRRPYDYATQMTGGEGQFQNGIAPEYIVELCNELNADAWVNIPHLADDDYVRNFMTLLRVGLKPGLKVNVEWSNEVWNYAPGYVANRWVQQQLALPENAGVTFEQFVARQERRVFSVCSDVFAGQGDRLVRVVAGFEANPWYTANLLQNMNGQFDAVSCAAYFGPDPNMLAGYSSSTTVDQVVSDTRASIPEWLALLRRHRQLADTYSASLGRPIKLLAYEGGPALEGHGRPYQQALNLASQDPRMYGIYRDFLIGANAAGLDLLMNFQYTGPYSVYTPYGNYGALMYMDQPTADAPRYHALMDAVNGSLFAAPAKPLPVLLVIANQDFNYREYADTRQALEAAGLTVQVAAATTATATPQAGTGQGADGGLVTPDLALADVSAVNYSAVVFVGGAGAAAYQVAFPGTYVNDADNGSAALHDAVNRLINDFTTYGKYVTGVGDGVSVLAWARVGGQSLLAGRRVVAPDGTSPAFRYGGALYQGVAARLHEQVNGATVFAPGSLGDPTTAADDVWVDGTIITAENADSARSFGQLLARQLTR
jgi:putative intracellular protease/amidase